MNAPEPTVDTSDLPLRKRLTFRIVVSMVAFLLLALGTIGLTLILSWQLEGTAAAINDAGSLRMRTYRFAFELTAYRDKTEQVALVHQHLDEYQQTLDKLSRGDPSRPLTVPKDRAIQQQLAAIRGEWNDRVRPIVLAALQEQTDRDALLQSHADDLQHLTTTIDRFVTLLEIDNAQKTEWLRLCQIALAMLAVATTTALLYLMFLIVIRPLDRLASGIRGLTEGNYDAKVDIDSDDEFGQVGAGFNLMADRLKNAHGQLEARVQEKTATLVRKNTELSLLYDMAGFLNRPASVEELCEGFLHRIVGSCKADGGTVRLHDHAHDALHIVAQQGMSAQMLEQERCIHLDHCLCGAGARQQVNRIEMLSPDTTEAAGCQREGYQVVTIFQIGTQERSLGIFNLYFRHARIFTRQESQLLEALGQQLATAIDNQRLAAKERELAVMEERNLFAQGLHDSIAQGLSFLNLQVQILEGAMQDRDGELAEQTISLIRTGIQESYDDVRELLNNFRTKLGVDDLSTAIGTLLEKFRHQTGISVEFQHKGFGAPILPEQQLQMLFILQEALSNIRKHAQADRVVVRLEDEQELLLSVNDNGGGFDPALLNSPPEEHYGLNIMRERARRAGLELDIATTPGHGTRVLLRLQRENRQLA